MAKTSIEWADCSWNPIVGCSRVSEGCMNCYAERLSFRLEKMGMPQYQGITRKSGGKIKYTGKMNFVEKALNEPFSWRKPKLVFVNSMSDLFHKKIEREHLIRIFNVMESCPQHIFLILTKRPENVTRIGASVNWTENIWLGVSVESDRYIYRLAELERLRTLYGVKATFASFEPLIGEISYDNLFKHVIADKGNKIDWAIVGGESGTGARPMKPEWATLIQKACVDGGVAFLFKQWGAYGEDGVKRSKKENGRELEGRIWNQMPQPYSLFPPDEPLWQLGEIK